MTREKPSVVLSDGPPPLVCAPAYYERDDRSMRFVYKRIVEEMVKIFVGLHKKNKELKVEKAEKKNRRL